MREPIATKKLILLLISLEGREISAESTNEHRDRMAHQERHHWHKPSGIESPHRQYQHQKPHPHQKYTQEQAYGNSWHELTPLKSTAFLHQPR